MPKGSWLSILTTFWQFLEPSWPQMKICPGEVTPVLSQKNLILTNRCYLSSHEINECLLLCSSLSFPVLTELSPDFNIIDFSIFCGFLSVVMEEVFKIFILSLWYLFYFYYDCSFRFYTSYQEALFLFCKFFCFYP